eukprot:CAMPEP_0203897882 /NCGR_PEP_ID=MMETSP0359-20131031/40458_1 /ASSEMBLY_ACC=CAM_ASM_000338 /TAXON_ID=268821 /ORGANISM="Scrippsiella Hangoei, Strain SHTV-5" /LENGTH=126 /DNA_ID=CAMNT_0050820857 /DNA_START=34 /DNA_END=415 /DNA_ORIENTATION=+
MTMLYGSLAFCRGFMARQRDRNEDQHKFATVRQKTSLSKSSQQPTLELHHASVPNVSSEGPYERQHGWTSGVASPSSSRSELSLDRTRHTSEDHERRQDELQEKHHASADCHKEEHPEKGLFRLQA